MKLRHWCALLGMVWSVGVTSGWGQNREAAPGGKPAPSSTDSWSLDFWTRWPAKDEDFRDCILARSTDALARGYYLDPRSLSPDRRFGVLIPRFGVVRDGPNFLVEVNLRRVVGMLGGAGFAFPKSAAVGWTYQWAPDNTALVIEQAGESKKEWARVSWRLVELHEGFIGKETDLLKNPGKAPAWLDIKQPPTHERSEPPVPAPAAVLAESSAGPNAWSVQRDGDHGPLQMVQGGTRRQALPPVQATGADATGAVRALSSDELPGLPLCFFSPHEKWLFVNQITRVDPETGRQWRTAALYWRNDGAEDKAPSWKAPMSGSFEDEAWETFARRNQVEPATVAPPDASGFRDRTIEFVNWSEKSGRILLYLRARNGAVTAKDVRPAYYRWYCYFDTTKLAFDATFELDSANDDLRTRWNSGDESLAPSKILLRVGDPGGSTLFAPFSDVDSFADGELNGSYKALLERTGQDGAEEIRQKQRTWLAYRETIARVHALNRWSSFPEEVLHEGRFLATRRRADALKELAVAAGPKENKALKEKSPDGKFAILYTYGEEDLTREGRPQGAELVTLPAKETVLDLFDDMTNNSMKAFWAPDSRHLAYHAASRRIAGITIYERRGGKFEQLNMPDLERFHPVLKKGERGYHFNYSDLALKRWLGPDKLLAHYGIGIDVENPAGETRMATADYDLVLVIEKGKIRIEKATKTASEN